MKRGWMIAVAAVLLAVAGRQARALSEQRNSPDIFFPNGYDKARSEAILAVAQDKQFHYLTGLTSYWEPKFETTLNYDGDTASLNAFVARLEKVPGIRVRLTFSRDLAKETGSALLAGSWWLEYEHDAPDVVTVRVNLAAKQLDLDKLEVWTAAQP